MSRPIADTTSFLNDAPARDREAPSWNVLSLEAQLWIEVFLLMGFGVVMIYSASSILAIRKYGDAAHYLKRQLICMGLGAATMLVFSRVPLKKLLDRAHWLLLLIYTESGREASPGRGGGRTGGVECVYPGPGRPPRA